MAMFLFLVMPAHEIGVPAENAAVRAEVADATTVGESYPVINLEEVVARNLLGIHFEFRDEEIQTKLVPDMERFFRYQRGDMSVTERASYLVQCLSGNQPGIFCDYLSPGWPSDASEAEVLKRKHKDDAKVAIEALRNADLITLRDMPEAILRRGLRTFKSFESLLFLSETLIQAKSCFPETLPTLLGLKAEDLFPNEVYRKAALDLYEKAALCGSKNSEMANLARFRASLLHIWSDRCDLAENHLDQLLLDTEKTFLTRAIYWQAQCAQRQGRKTDFAVKKNRLIKVNPLGYHALSITYGRPNEVMSLVYSDQPAQAMLRSKLRRDLNGVLRVIELALSDKEIKDARRLLRFVEDNSQGIEGEVLVYLAVLWSRAQNEIGKFRVLARAFREYPGLISRQTLEVFYPLKHFETIARYSHILDPYLVTAIIRQESGFITDARSPAGAMGLMQLMPATARTMGLKSRWSLVRPQINVQLGVRYFEQMLRRFNGDAELALAAYNAGPMNVDRWIARYPTDNRMLFLDLIPISETRDYVSLIARNYFWYLNLYGGDVNLVGIPAADVADRAPASSVRKQARFSAFASF